MNTSNITKSALALALGLCASGTWAVTVTNVIEQFTVADDTAVTSLTTANLDWTTLGTDNASIVSGDNDNLVLDTGDGLVRATLTTNDVTKAIADGQTATFEASVSFTPATETPDVSGDDLRFALFAKANGATTNFCVISQNATNVTDIVIANANPVKVVVTFPSANAFYVTVGERRAPASGNYSFINSGDFTKVEFQGNGTVDDLLFAYDYAKSASQPVTISGGDYTLANATEADYVNDLVNTKGATAVDKALEGVTEAQFKQAALLNQDITASDFVKGEGSYSFNVTNVKRSGDNVLVTVVLTRTAALSSAINGTLVLQTSTDGGTTWKDGASVTMTDSDFADDTATFSLPKTGNGNIFKAVIR